MADPTQDGLKYHGQTAAVVKAKLHLDEAQKSIVEVVEHLSKTPMQYGHEPLLRELREQARKVMALSATATRDFKEMGL